MSNRTPLLVISTLVVLGATARAQVALPQFAPHFYTTDPNNFGRLTWDRHEYLEDTANTVFVLARDIVTLDPGHDMVNQPRPDALFFNFAHFLPPEGDPAPLGQRRICRESIEGKGLQLYVNYSGARIDSNPVNTQRYPEPTFFLALDGPQVNDQPQVGTLPAVVSAGFSSAMISATRGAFGHVGTVPAYSTVPLLHEKANPGFRIDALYVTAGTGFGSGAFVPADQPLWTQITNDRFFVRGTAGTPQEDQWIDKTSTYIPQIAFAGNSSGVCFADFNGDGWLDLYVGKPGDDYNGAQNRLLLFSPTGGAFVDTSGPANLPSTIDATIDVQAGDVNGDGFPDIVVGNRLPRSGTTGTTIDDDYILINDGAAHFTKVPLVPRPLPAIQDTDTRSVAIGDLTGDGIPEIVLGNAGSDGPFDYTTSVVRHPIQVFTQHTPGVWEDDAFTTTLPSSTPFFLAPEEAALAGPLTQQVLIADLFAPAPATSPASFTPDGRKDLIVVSHGELLTDVTPGAFDSANGRITVFCGPSSFTSPHLLAPCIFAENPWIRAVALGDFTTNPGDAALGVMKAAPGTLDFLAGAGNRFSGADPFYIENLGGATPFPFPPGLCMNTLANILTYDAFPGNERGYGLDLADVDNDGDMDALQASRMYNYLVFGVGKIDTANGQAPDAHHNLTSPSSPVQLEIDRGRATPEGMEDGVFADFDGDGRKDIMMVGQRFASYTIPGGRANNMRSEVTILYQDPTAPGTFVHSTQNVTDSQNGPVPIVEDSRMNIQLRNAPLSAAPAIADRVVAGDLDNDGDVDAIVHLFEIPKGAAGLPGANLPTIPDLTSLDNILGFGILRYSSGWRYLRNDSTVGSIQMTDVATARMVDSASGSFSPKWNRPLGMDVLADFNNDGGLDLYTTVGFSFDLGGTVGNPPAVGTVSSTTQTDDLLFLNSLGGGVLKESSVKWIKQVRLASGSTTRNAGSFGLAQGDIDNDGDVDVLVTHSAKGDWASFPSLYLNTFPTASPLFFTDSFTARVPTLQTQLSTMIRSEVVGSGSSAVVHDRYSFPAIFDFDGDGDLDIVIQVFNNLPRFFQNQGFDRNGDGLINAADNTPLGTFKDVTSQMVSGFRQTVNAEDMQAVDIDFDGDLDLVVDPFDDEVFPWENKLALPDGKPSVTDAWPRVGAVRGSIVQLTGANFTGATSVDFIFRNNQIVTVSSGIAVSDPHHLKLTLPPRIASTPVGLAQVRVNTPTSRSTQYFGYFLLN